MLSDEEREALEILNNTEWDGFMITIKNLIEKQSKEIEELNKSDASKEQSSMKYYNLYKELVDKIKAKIEELEKGNKNTFIRGEKILVLESLLEKE